MNDICVYRISTCHWCDKVEAFLKEHGIKYTSVVIDLLPPNEQERALKEAYRLSKQRSFPVTIINGECVIGFHESRLRQLLKLSPEKEVQSSVTSATNKDSGCLFQERTENEEEIKRMYEWLFKEADKHGYKINPDKELVNDLVRGLVVNEKRYGYKACPCRLASGRYHLDYDIICPCTYCSSDIEKYGRCYCALFVSDRFLSGDPSLPDYFFDRRKPCDVCDKQTESGREKVIETIPTRKRLYNTYIKIVGFTQEKTESDHNKAQNGFLEMIKFLELDNTLMRWDENNAALTFSIDNMQVTIQMKQDIDFYTYQIACKATAENPVNTNIFFQRMDLLEFKNSVFTCIIILPGSDFTKEDSLRLIPNQKYMSNIYHKYQIVAGFSGKTENEDIFIIKSDEQLPEMIVNDIETLETSYYLLCNEKQRYALAEDKLNEIDTKFVAKMSTMSMNLSDSHPETLKEWLHELSNDFGEMSGFAEESRHRMNYTIIKRDLIRRIIKDWDENATASGLPTLSRFYLDKIDSLGDQYTRLFMRNDGLRREMSDLIAMLRTKVDIIVQEQSLDIQRSIDETAKTQMKVQHMVEGLSIIALSYYTTHLAGFIFESLEEGHILHISSATMKAFFVPVAIAMSWYLTFRARQLIIGKNSIETENIHNGLLKNIWNKLKKLFSGIFK